MYVDGVFAGGGIKAMAMLGSIEIAEQRGIRFKRAVGTSAGAIVAAFAIAGISSQEMKRLVDSVDLRSFMDARKSLLSRGFLTKWIRLYWRLGLYKGEHLEKWIGDVLAQRGIVTFSDLKPGSLKVIASDLTRGRLIVLPDDLKDYGLNPGSFPVARAIRMSCSLPYFFEPIKLYNGAGEKCLIVDGGVLSNFPIWVFEKGNELLPTRPVLGFQLSSRLEERPPNKINNAIQLYQALFDTMKEAHDARYISKKHVKNIIFIPVEHFDTTNFDLTEEKKEELVELGRRRAASFFKKWNY